MEKIERTLEQRVENIERRNRIIRNITTLIVLLGGGVAYGLALGWIIWG